MGGAVCPADGPERATVERTLEPVDIQIYYERLAAAARGLAVRELARLDSGQLALPILHIGPIGERGGKRILVIAGLRGDETSASLSALSLLTDAREHADLYRGVELHLLAPANPVGLANQSPWDQLGCDVARDFGSFRTPEAKAIRHLVGELKPALVVSLHESAEDGFHVIGTRNVPRHLLESIAASVRGELGITSGNVYQREGWFGAGSSTLSGWTAKRGVPVLLVESPRLEPDIRQRIAAHLLAVRAAARELAGEAR